MTFFLRLTHIKCRKQKKNFRDVLVVRQTDTFITAIDKSQFQNNGSSFCTCILRWEVCWNQEISTTTKERPGFWGRLKSLFQFFFHVFCSFILSLSLMVHISKHLFKVSLSLLCTIDFCAVKLPLRYFSYFASLHWYCLLQVFLV